ncbi:helix-turn-helix transcriptional regulator [Actinoplanes bogorensis]|uniref:Helix-turn-helix transcriptional regulator n=1 Tax=Paractinoplanes bogorensis TaxID=1610840 RepID=A0ABS5YXC3_9ACTN|nr:NB-ARC domain-containing protein [Actinoplanes bogorensis]MBU2668099.1 helix-turn-helix transcriptional regulator [Actinoplanes bogorensis]
MFGEVVRRHRTKLLITQEELAERTGVSVRHIRYIESGRVATPRAVTVRLLAEAFQLTAADRVTFEQSARTGEEPVAPVAVDAPAGPVRPAQLPAPVTGFAGRTGHLRALDSAGDPVVLVVGAGGVGKTTLALHWAHTATDRFPDGQLYANLRGFDPSGTVAEPADVLHGFLGALGITGPQVPATRHGRAALYRSLLSDRRMLIVLDNAGDADQVRPLLPGTAACRVLVTSRDSLTGLVVSDSARVLPLAPMETGEARELLSLRLGEQRVAAEPGPVDRLIERCDRLPIALALVAARLATSPGSTVERLTAEIGDPARTLDGLTVGDTRTDIRAVFSWSYRKLSAPAARLFRLLAVHPGPDLPVEAAASLAGVELRAARAGLAELIRFHLVREHRPGRYELHDLLRAYAAELAGTDETAAGRGSALRRTVDHYVRIAAAAAGLLLPHRDPVAVPEGEPGVVPVCVEDRDAAMGWFADEHQVLLAVLDIAMRPELDAYVEPWCQSFVAFASLRGHWADELRGHRAALTVAERHGDRARQGRGHLGIAIVHLRLSDPETAERHFRLALDAYEKVGDLVGAGHVNSNLARLKDAADRPGEALVLGWAALQQYTAAGHGVFRARALSGLGWYQAKAGDHAGALRSGLEALTLLRDIGDRDGEAATLDTLGYAYGQAGDHTEAVAHYQRAASLHHDMGDRYNEALVLSHIGDSERELGLTERARTTWTAALEILTDLGHQDAEGLRRRLSGLG